MGAHRQGGGAARRARPLTTPLADGATPPGRTVRVLPDVTGLDREFDYLVPAALIERLQLRRPIYQQTAAYGHFGRDLPGFTWEQTNEADALRKAAEALA